MSNDLTPPTNQPPTNQPPANPAAEPERIPFSIAIDNLDNERQRKFLRAFASYGTLSAAERQSRVSRQSHYKWRDKDPRYRSAFKACCDNQSHILEHALLDRAINGWEEPVFHEGMECGTKIKHDNKLGISMLGVLDRRYSNVDKAENNVEVNVNNNTHNGHVIYVEESASEDEWEKGAIEQQEQSVNQKLPSLDGPE